MKTLEQITVTGDFPAAPWLGTDVAERDRAWAEVRQACREAAASRGLRLTEGIEDRHVLYERPADDRGGAGGQVVECTRSEAEFVRRRLSAWAEPQ